MQQWSRMQCFCIFQKRHYIALVDLNIALKNIPLGQVFIIILSLGQVIIIILLGQASQMPLPYTANIFTQQIYSAAPLNCRDYSIITDSNKILSEFDSCTTIV